MIVTDITPRLFMEIPELPDAVAETLVLESAREFCRRSRAWREDITINRTTGVRTASIVPSSTVDRELVEIVQVIDENGKKMAYSTARKLDVEDEDWRNSDGLPEAFIREGDNTLRWNREPQTTLANAYTVTIALMPVFTESLATLTFTLGGSQTVAPGDTLQDASTSGTGIVQAGVTEGGDLGSGTWLGENAAGTIVFQQGSIVGTFDGGQVDRTLPTSTTDILTGGTFTAESYSRQIADELTDQWIEPLVSGALYRAYRMPRKVWSSQPQAAIHQAMYEEGIALAEVRAEDGRHKGVARKVQYGGL